MSTCQAKISELLEQCQNEWVKLESLAKEDKATISQTSKELREAIKSLVQLQDNLDETSTEMDQKANMLMDDVRKRLNFALNVFTTHIHQIQEDNRAAD
ncbi:hypothetical protein G6F56_013739 [Rhizopus delemar]|nr:hypothetical protein G6F56_013739 [Rhizopus delemar]